MRVAYIVGTFPSLSETFILREMRALLQRGIEVSAYALERGPTEHVHADATEFTDTATYPSAAACIIGALTCHPVCFLRALALLPTVARIPGVGFRRAARRLAAACAFRRTAHDAKIDRVHAHFALAPADVGRFLATLLDVPHSLSVHARDIHVQSAESLSARLHAAKFVSVCTEDGRRTVLAKCPELSPSRIHLIRHGLFLDRWPPAEDILTPCKVWESCEARLLAVGRLEPKKGFTHLVEACRLLRDDGISFGCVIAGSGTEQERLQQQIADSALAEHVQLVGAVSLETCRGLYAQATVFVLPAITMADGDRDGVPNVLLEACACGLPVVSTPTGGIPELVDDGGTGLLVQPRDPRALADAMASLLGDPDLRTRLGQAGRRKTEQEYDLAQNVAALVALLNRT